MSKDTKDRVKETLKFIRTYPGVPNYQRMVAADHGAAWIKANFASKTTFDTFSNSLSHKNNANAGDETARARRRACVLLATVLARPALEKTGYRTAPAAGLDAVLRTLIEKAYWAGDKSGTACLDVLANGLMRDPVTWLNANELLLSGGDIAGKTVFHLSYDGGYNRFCIEPMNAIAQQHGCYFEGIQIPAVAWHQWTPGGNNHSNMTGVSLDAGPDIMITTQMTGCSLVYKRATNGKVYVAHAYPDTRNRDAAKKKTGSGLAEELKGQHGATAADFSNATGGTVEVYGPTGDGTDGYDMDTNRLYIVGIRRAGAWKIYGQHVASGTRALRVYRLYPTPVVQRP